MYDNYENKLIKTYNIETETYLNRELAKLSTTLPNN